MSMHFAVLFLRMQLMYIRTIQLTTIDELACRRSSRLLSNDDLVANFASTPEWSASKGSSSARTFESQ